MEFILWLIIGYLYVGFGILALFEDLKYFVKNKLLSLILWPVALVIFLLKRDIK